MNTLLNATSFDGYHFIKQLFGSFGCSPAKVAFTTFGAYQFSRSSQAETLRCGFMGFDLIFSFSWLSWHNHTPLTQNSAEKSFPSADD